MRNLTIKREKTFVACLGKFKVYIEDANSNELTIRNTPCRKLGELKNGQESTFVIDDSEAKIYVIADKMSKEYCNEMYKIPAGTEDKRAATSAARSRPLDCFGIHEKNTSSDPETTSPV